MIRYVLDHQLVKNWVLDECDYRNQFEYGWEQESLLSALFSVATPLAGPYIWRTNTAVYPWRLSLKRLDTTGRPEMYVRRRHNMTSYQRQKDPQNIVTRLYPLGYGEGVNQLGSRERERGASHTSRARKQSRTNTGLLKGYGRIAAMRTRPPSRPRRRLCSGSSRNPPSPIRSAIRK